MDDQALESASLLLLRDGLPDLVDTGPALDRVLRAVASGTGPVAVDAERASGYRYSQRAYLVQLRRAGAGTALIDPIPFGDVPNCSLAPLADAVGDWEWIIHAASQDLPCLAQLGLQPARLFDTELAGRLLNYPRVGLAVLVEDLLGFSMRKEHSAVDWSRRPLPQPWLEYAALDVEMLIELKDALAAQLLAAGKADWAAQEFAMWVSSGPAAPRLEPWRRTSGIHRVRGRRKLAIVRAIWEHREALARSRDIAVGRILHDSAIVEAASLAPTSRSALGRLAGFRTRNAQRYLTEFAAAVCEALALPDSELPQLSATLDGPPPPRTWGVKFPEAAARLGRGREVVNALAAQRDVPPENLLAPDAIRRLAWTPPAPPTPKTVADALRDYRARPWQVELTAAALAAALESPRQ
ncbi:MAG: HRDC domain-containing protein [Nocardioidaceae bacterium]